MFETPTKSVTTLITKSAKGEYSTTIHGNVIETVFFGTDGSSETVGRSIVFLSEYAHSHIGAHESTER